MDSDFSKPQDKRTPSFRKPPVVEVVCGVQFSTLPGWQTSHYGLFWNSVRSQYPDCEDQPPIARLRLGDFEEQIQPELSSLPPLRRVFLIDSSKSCLMQVQENRFLLNWRRVNADDDYQRFEATFARFVEQWNQFRSFLDSEKLPAPRVEAYELTYVNVIAAPQAVFPRDIWQFLNFYKELPETAFGATPRVLNLKVGWPMEGKIGKLSLDVKHGKRNAEPAEDVLIAEFAAKGEADKNADDMESWFRSAHDAIVYTFDSLTTDLAHSLWERVE